MATPRDSTASPVLLHRAWYAESLAGFLVSDPDVVIGRLTKNSEFAVLPTQRDAWLAQIGILRDCLHVSTFVKALLDCDQEQAQGAFAQLTGRYPVVLTRDLGVAKQWIRHRARGSERYGLIASSKAQRRKPHAIDIRVDVDPVPWFLNGKDDTRSSYYLEDAATEFQVRGLELDWTCVTWDGDLRFAGSGWSYHDFRGDRWCNIGNGDNRVFLRNAYRVLLTRARQGMVVFVPPGDTNDSTRLPAFYDSTFNYLRELGIPALG